MEIEQKLELLKSLGTKDIYQRITTAENELERLLTLDTNYRYENTPYLASYGEDCAYVKNLLAELAVEPPVSVEGKKLTAVQTEAWLRQQRTKNEPLAKAIKQQNDTTFVCENRRVAIEMCKKRLESLKGLLALRTAQIEFLK